MAKTSKDPEDLTPAMQEHLANLRYKRLRRLISQMRWRPDELRWLLQHCPDMPTELVQQVQDALRMAEP